MKKVHKFCEENNIVYYLAYGTLLGAMRHQGFIPWDDDIDIWMLRSDYEKFLTLFPKYQDALGLKVVNHKTKPYYGRPMSKVIDNRTYLVEPEYKYDDAIGVFVDIWPLDALPNNERQRKIAISKLRHYTRQLFGSIDKKLRFGSFSELKQTVKKMVYMGMNSKDIVEKIEDYITSFRNEDSDYLVNSTWGKYVLRKEYFASRFLTKFEDTEFYVPSAFNQILTERYGDWKKFPPKSEQEPHHVVNVFWK